MNLRSRIRSRARQVHTVSDLLESRWDNSPECSRPYRSAKASLTSAIGALVLAVGQVETNPTLSTKHIHNARSRVREAVRMMRHQKKEPSR